MNKYPSVSCSQCGQSFGPGDSGYSHCKDHTRMISPPHLQTAPTRSQLAAMTRHQDQIKASNNAQPMPRHCLEKFCRCVVCPFTNPPSRAQVGRGNTEPQQGASE